ncbi:hypothetical protein BDZ85DRAFT_80365 [Elsinoe ampelina]|uniref:Only prolin and serin are matching in the corresponding protein n=1 Tax=Elsinoe ampelina TaxID=302913 RepID=A0A6A6FZD3_9PEZI|nr:hypothetical protein BDZ85DRAFT_80365 [Elsinoe ampelina]
MRLPSNPLLTIDTTSAAKMSTMDISPQMPSSHSRGSSQNSGSSDYPTPGTPTFSLPDHSRVASSTSSLASTPPACDRPESPTLPPKSMLHDLVEDPSEREDSFDYDCRDRAPSFSNDESDFYSSWTSRASMDYDLSDGFRSDTDCPSPKKIREHDTSPATTLKTRLSQRMPSLSRKLRDKRSFSSLAFHGVRSAPASRAPSIRSPSVTKSLASNIDVSDFAMDSPPIPEVPALPQHIHSFQPTPSDISLSTQVEDPIDRKALASTPLLPPCMMERKQSETGSVQSPLQSPTVADQPMFTFPSASVTPVASTVQSPTLSTRPSTASFAYSQSRNSIEMGPTGPFEHLADEWADRLGHANFDIWPAPYLPAVYDLESCRTLVEDWESARKQYLVHANRVSEDYGPTSNTLKMTEQKWSAIDAAWKENNEKTLERARAQGIDVDNVQRLSEQPTLAKIPSLPKPTILADNGEIVGPMVTYVSRIKPMPKKNAFLRFFSDLRLSSS